MSDCSCSVSVTRDDQMFICYPGPAALRGTISSSMPLFDLLVPYAARTQLLNNLSAYDVAKLDMSLGLFLDAREREIYLNPLRDLVFDVAEVRALEAYGMKLLLLGNDVSALQQRLKNPHHYIHGHGRKRKLQIYLIAHCPVITKTTGIRDRLLSFSLFGVSSMHGTLEDTLHMSSIEAVVLDESLDPDAAFILSLGARPRPSERPGSWLRVPTIPDNTIDLRVYIPSLHDRQHAEYRFPLCEAWHLSRCMLRRAWPLSWLVDAFYTHLRVHNLSAAYLTSSGLHRVEPYGRLWSRGQLKIRGSDMR